MLALMAMGSEDVGRLAIGRDVIGDEDVIQLGRDINSFGGAGWGLGEVDDANLLKVSVVGRGVGNVGRKVA